MPSDSRSKKRTEPAPADAIALSVEQARARIGVSRDKFYKLIRQKQLPARKLGKRTLILVSDLAALVESLPRIEGA
jgi:excisionase family DNA binding protein